MAGSRLQRRLRHHHGRRPAEPSRPGAAPHRQGDDRPRTWCSASSTASRRPATGGSAEADRRHQPADLRPAPRPWWSPTSASRAATSSTASARPGRPIPYLTGQALPTPTAAATCACGTTSARSARATTACGASATSCCDPVHLLVVPLRIGALLGFRHVVRSMVLGAFYLLSGLLGNTEVRAGRHWSSWSRSSTASRSRWCRCWGSTSCGRSGGHPSNPPTTSSSGSRAVTVTTCWSSGRSAVARRTYHDLLDAHPRVPWRRPSRPEPKVFLTRTSPRGASGGTAPPSSARGRRGPPR